MADIAGIISEIDGVGALYKKGRSSTLLQGLSKSISAKVESLVNFDTCTAVRLSDVIKTSNLPEDLQSILTDACDKRLQVPAWWHFGEERHLWTKRGRRGLNYCLVIFLCDSSNLYNSLF